MKKGGNFRERSKELAPAKALVIDEVKKNPQLNVRELNKTIRELYTDLHISSSTISAWIIFAKTGSYDGKAKKEATGTAEAPQVPVITESKSGLLTSEQIADSLLKQVYETLRTHDLQAQKLADAEVALRRARRQMNVQDNEIRALQDSYNRLLKIHNESVKEHKRTSNVVPIEELERRAHAALRKELQDKEDGTGQGSTT